MKNTDFDQQCIQLMNKHARKYCDMCTLEPIQIKSDDETYISMLLALIQFSSAEAVYYCSECNLSLCLKHSYEHKDTSLHFLYKIPGKH